MTCLPFFHKYRLVKSEAYTDTSYSSDFDKDRGIGFDRTRLYFRCDNCLKTKLKRIDGHWELTELQNEK